jgi:hypothetical protein
VRSSVHRDYTINTDGFYSVPVALRPGQTVAEYAASHGMSVNAFMARARRVGSAELLARQLNAANEGGSPDVSPSNEPQNDHAPIVHEGRP